MAIYGYGIVTEIKKYRYQYILFSKTLILPLNFRSWHILRSWQIDVAKSINFIAWSRGKNILEQLSRTRFFTRFENPALFSLLRSCREKAWTSNHVRNHVLESCSYIFFPLVVLNDSLRLLVTKLNLFRVRLLRVTWGKNRVYVASRSRSRTDTVLRNRNGL